MAAIPQLDENIEYEFCYFDDGEFNRIQIVAASREDAMAEYLEQGRHINELYSIRPDN